MSISTISREVSRAVGARRLLKLAEFLRTLPRKRFSYLHWVGNDWKGKPDLSCGTAACAMGWACTMPTFRRLGLRMEVTGHHLDGSLSGDPIVKGLEYTGGIAKGIESAMHLFGISPEHAQFLFIPNQDINGDMVWESDRAARIAQGDDVSPTENATPEQVAHHIEKFVKKYMTPKEAK